MKFRLYHTVPTVALLVLLLFVTAGCNEKAAQEVEVNRTTVARDHHGVESSTQCFDEGSSEFLEAIKKSDAKVVSRLLSNVVNINALWEDQIGNKSTALMLASERGHQEIVRLLLEAGADVNVRPEGGPTALILAANRGHTRIVNTLLQNGADVNARNEFGATPLINAAARGYREIVELLLSHGADTSARLRTPLDLKGETALTIAAKGGYKEIVDLILRSGEKLSDQRISEINSMLKEAERNRTFIFGKLVEKSNSYVRVNVFDSIYKFPIEDNTRFLDEHGNSISVTDLVVGDAVTVALNKNRVMEIYKGGIKIELERSW